MRSSRVLVASVLLLVLASTRPCKAIDWKAFDDPKALVLTDPFAESIAKLTGAGKAEAVKRLHESLKSTEVEIRRRAALTLGRLGDRSGVLDLPAQPRLATRCHWRYAGV